MVVRMFDELVPGPQLLAALVALDMGPLGPGETAEVVRAWAVCEAWVAANKLAAVTSLAHFDFEPGPDQLQRLQDPVFCEDLADELAPLLRISRGSAFSLLGMAKQLARLELLTTAFTAGELDQSRVRVITTAVEDLTDEQAVEVVERVLPRAPQLTPGQLRPVVARAVAAVDQKTIQERHEAAREHRCVQITPVVNGMAELWALLPAVEARAVYTAINDHARAQRKTSAAGKTGSENASETGSEIVNGHETASATEDRPFWRARGQESKPSMDARRADALVDLVLGRTTSQSQKPLVHLIVPADLHKTGAAELQGYGPIPASEAKRVMATARVDIKKVLVDPKTGVPIPPGCVHNDNDPYRPTQQMREYIEIRDDKCRFPGCPQPATRSDLDHTIPWGKGENGGRTCPCNLVALCRAHHRAKTHGGWTTTQHPNGDLEWTSPTGKKYVTKPEQYDITWADTG